MLDEGFDMYNHVCCLLPFYGCEFNEGLYFYVRNERNCGSAIFSRPRKNTLFDTLYLSLSLSLAGLLFSTTIFAYVVEIDSNGV